MDSSCWTCSTHYVTWGRYSFWKISGKTLNPQQVEKSYRCEDVRLQSTSEHHNADEKLTTFIIHLILGALL